VKGFKTLFWLESRRSGVWALALCASLALWAWGIYQARGIPVGDRTEVRTILLVMAAIIGAGVLALMVGRLRGESRGGQVQVLLLTPPSGFTHIAARLSFALAVALVYYVVWGALASWIVALDGQAYGVGFGVRGVLGLTLGLPAYVLAVAVLPLLAWTLLLATFTSAYRVAGPNLIPGTVVVLGSVIAARWLVDGVVRVAYSLPSWPLFVGPASQTSVTIIETPDGQGQITTAAQGILYLPQEPVWIGLALATALCAVASRLWREVEA